MKKYAQYIHKIPDSMRWADDGFYLIPHRMWREYPYGWGNLFNFTENSPQAPALASAIKYGGAVHGPFETRQDFIDFWESGRILKWNPADEKTMIHHVENLRITETFYVECDPNYIQNA